MPVTDLVVRDLVADFLQHHRMHSAPDTPRIYGQGLAWLVRGFGDLPWGELQRVKVRDALFASYHWPPGATKSGKMSDSTERRNKASFHRLQQYVVNETKQSDHTVLLPIDLTKPSSGRREKIPTSAELARAIAETTPAFALVLRGFRHSGMRPSELCRADLAMIETSVVEVKGEPTERRVIVLAQHKTGRKTGKPRRIALGESLAAVVAEAAAGRPQGPICRGHVWVDESGKPWTPRRIRDRWRELRRRLRLAEDLVPYSIRHYAGTKATKKAGIHAAAQLLGHRDIKTTQRYAHGDDEDSLEAQAAIDRAA